MHNTSPSRMACPSDWPASHDDDTQFDLKISELRDYGTLGIVASIHAEPRVLPDRMVKRSQGRAPSWHLTIRSKVRAFLHNIGMILHLIPDDYSYTCYQMVGEDDRVL